MKRWTLPHIEYTLPWRPVRQRHHHSIYSTCRQKFLPRHLDVSCRKTQRPPHLMARHHLPQQCIRIAQQASGLHHVSTLNHISDQAAADFLTLQRTCRDYLYTHFLSPMHILRHRTAIMTETMVISHQKHSNTQPTYQNFTHKLQRRHPAQRFCERQHLNALHPSTSQQNLLLRQSRQQLRHIVRRDHLPRVTVKSNEHRLKRTSARHILQLFNQTPMATMHAIKKTDCRNISFHLQPTISIHRWPRCVPSRKTIVAMCRFIFTHLFLHPISSRQN